jgi:hypothetical protein
LSSVVEVVLKSSPVSRLASQFLADFNFDDIMTPHDQPTNHHQATSKHIILDNRDNRRQLMKLKSKT